uniref:Uncharacterized protein n=1 Tax=Anguilla anguilla TaxID=7936 RepID=A0A0E9QXE3_ANGAN
MAQQDFGIFNQLLHHCNSASHLDLSLSSAHTWARSESKTEPVSTLVQPCMWAYPTPGCNWLRVCAPQMC